MPRPVYGLADTRFCRKRTPEPTLTEERGFLSGCYRKASSDDRRLIDQGGSWIERIREEPRGEPAYPLSPKSVHASRFQERDRVGGALEKIVDLVGRLKTNDEGVNGSQAKHKA
jgi:hypothetical protein